jgi:hypothetical protein
MMNRCTCPVLSTPIPVPNAHITPQRLPVGLSLTSLGRFGSVPLSRRLSPLRCVAGMLTFILCAPVAGLQIQNRFAAPKAKGAKAAAPVGGAPVTPSDSMGSGTSGETAVVDAMGGAAKGTADVEDGIDWLDVEKTFKPQADRYLFAIAGRKCALFAAGTTTHHTTHHCMEDHRLTRPLSSSVRSFVHSPPPSFRCRQNA